MKLFSFRMPYRKPFFGNSNVFDTLLPPPPSVPPPPAAVAAAAAAKGCQDRDQQQGCHISPNDDLPSVFARQVCCP